MKSSAKLHKKNILLKFLTLFLCVLMNYVSFVEEKKGFSKDEVIAKKWLFIAVPP